MEDDRYKGECVLPGEVFWFVVIVVCVIAYFIAS